MPLARFWSTLTIEVKFPISMLCQAIYDKKMGYAGTLLQAVQAMLHSDSWHGPDHDV